MCEDHEGYWMSRVAQVDEILLRLDCPTLGQTDGRVIGGSVVQNAHGDEKPAYGTEGGGFLVFIFDVLHDQNFQR